MKKILLTIIKIYQKTLSPDHGIFRFMRPTAGCRFYPTCSEYVKLALGKHSLGKALILGFKRILKCHPLSNGGVDEV